MAPLAAARRAATPVIAAAAAARFTSVVPAAAAARFTSVVPAAAVSVAVTSMDRILRSVAARTLGRRAVSCPASLPNAATKTRGFSSSVLGNRSKTGGSLIATRGIANQASFPPELKRELQRIEAASTARHQELVKRFTGFQTSLKKEYAVLEVAKANATYQNALVVWRIVYGSLAAAALGIWLTLHTKSLWIRDFKIYALMLLTELVVKLQIDLEKELKKIVREEVDKGSKA